jgi:TPR repeat protein
MSIKRVVNAIGNLFRRKPSTNPQIPTSHHPSSHETLTNLFANNRNADQKTAKIQQAQADLADAIKQLSSSNRMLAKESSLKGLKLSDITEDQFSQLTVTELEELAKLYYEGDTSQSIDKNLSKAVKIWEIAAQKGSKEARYSRALCLKDGIGVDASPTLAFTELKALADEDNFNVAHVWNNEIFVR